MPSRRCRTQVELAAALGVTTRAVRAWRAAGMPGPAKDGRWNLAAVRAWRIERDRATRARRRGADAGRAFVRALTRVDRVPPEDLGDEFLAEIPASPPRCDDQVGTIAPSLDVDAQLAAGRPALLIVAEQDARRRYWLAERERLLLHKEASGLVEARSVVDEKVRLCAGFRRLLLEFSRRCAPRVLGIEDTLAVQRVLEGEAAATLESVQLLGGLPA